MIGSHGDRVGIVGQSRQPDSGDLAGWVYNIVKDVITGSQITRSQGCKGCHHFQEVNVTIITNDVCKSAPSRFYKKSISEAMLCAF